jgi:hypothetical protein
MDYGAVGAGDIDIVGALMDAITGDDGHEYVGAGDIDIVGALEQAITGRARIGAGEGDLIHDLLSGDGDGDMLGAVVRRAMHRSPAVQKAVRKANAMRVIRQIDPHAKMLRRADKYIHRLQTIGATTSVAVPAGGAFTITIQPQRPFKTKRWMVTSDIAFFFDVDDVKVGQVSQFAASSITPAASFTEQALGAAIDWDTADIGNLIVITGTNIDTVPHAFRSNLFGTSLVPQY